MSSFTARAVASAGANPYAVVIAGLSALEGIRHGGASARVEAMLGTLRREPDVRRAIAARLRRGDPIDGFGHPLYPGGDPRAAMLLALLRAHGRSTELDFVTAVADAAAAAVGEGPNLDFALAAVARALRLAPGAPLMLFALGRTIGWIGHAIEQHAPDRSSTARQIRWGGPDNFNHNAQLPNAQLHPKRERGGLGEAAGAAGDPISLRSIRPAERLGVGVSGRWEFWELGVGSFLGVVKLGVDPFPFSGVHLRNRVVAPASRQRVSSRQAPVHLGV